MEEVKRYRIYNPRGEDFIVEVCGDDVSAYIESEPYDRRKCERVD